MSDIWLRLGLIFVGIGLAYGAKRLGWVRHEHGTWLLRICFYVTIPILIFVSVAELGLSRELIIFPVLPAIIVAATFWIVTLVAKRFRLARASEGTFRIAPLVIGSNVALTFLLAIYGSEGVTRAALFNAGYNPLLLLGVYGLAATYNPSSATRRDVLKRVLILPPLWALVLAAAVNLSGWQVPRVVMYPLAVIGGLTLVLSVVALGILFEPRQIRLGKTWAIVGLRMGLGLLIGLVVAVGLGLQGVDRAAVLALAAAPIGFNLLTFVAVEKLDHDLAASAVSLSMALGLVMTPLILLLAR